MSAKERSSARMTSRIASLMTDGLSHHGWPLSSRIASLIPIAGERVLGLAEASALVTRAHKKLMPGVPLCGWDVAMTEPEGMLLLEGNLSCNFFRATFDEAAYCAFAESVLRFVEGA